MRITNFFFLSLLLSAITPQATVATVLPDVPVTCAGGEAIAAFVPPFLANFPLAVATVDQDGTFLYRNEAFRQMTKSVGGDSVQRLAEAFPSLSSELTAALVQARLKPILPAPFQVIKSNPQTGEIQTVFYRFQFHPYPTAVGSQVGIILEDVTAETLAYRQLVADVNNALVLGFAYPELIAEDFGAVLPPETRSHLMLIQEGNHRAAELLKASLQPKAAKFEPVEAVASITPVSASLWGILIVDDDASVLALARTFFQRAGFTVFSATDGGEGVAVYRANADQIHVIFSDLQMSKMDGPAMMTEIRRLNSTVPVLFQTGQSEIAGRKQIEKITHAQLITKPYARDIVVRRVTDILPKPQ